MQRPRNPYSSAEIDRASHEREDEERMLELASSGAARFVPIDTERNLVNKGSGNPEPVFLQGMMARAVAGAADHHIFLGYVEGTPYFAVDVTGKDVPLKDLGEFVDLRQVGALLFAREGSILAYARGMTYWHRRHRFCGVCGTATKVTRGGHVRVCTNEACKTEHFPRTDPVSIMLAVQGDRCVLGRSGRFAATMWSCLAGFIEPGEAIEDAVRRETLEEAGIRCGRVKYLFSQPWPFPMSLMIGCHARATSREITVDREELEDARWFTRDEVALMFTGAHPEQISIPPPIAIAHHIIRAWVEGEVG
jgi:NAD+ diphosphatase